MSKERETIIFLHIPKAAGSTLTYLLEKQFPPDKTYATSMTWHHPDGNLDRFHALTEAEKQNLALVNGHMGFGLHQNIPQTTKYITIIREPVARTLSQYQFESQLVDSPLYPIIQSGLMDLQEYIKYYDHYECDNLQTRMIAGNWDKRGYGKCTMDMLDEAKRNLREHFAVVGLANQFDAFYILCRRAFGWRYAFARKHNVAQKRRNPAELSLAEQELLLEHNRYDLELYDFAQALFAEQVQEQGIFFAIELAGYRLTRRVWHRLEDMYWEARRYSVRVFIQERLRALT